MDVMMIKTKWLRGIISSIIEKQIKKTGLNITVSLEDFEIHIEDGIISGNLQAGFKTSTKELGAIIEKVL